MINKEYSKDLQQAYEGELSPKTNIPQNHSF